MAKSSKDKPTKKAVSKDTDETPLKASSKPKKDLEDDEDLDGEEDFDAPKASKAGKSSSKAKGDDDDESDDDVDVDDDWEKVEEEENWDPDFDEFDIPKSKAKKSSTGGAAKKGKEDDDLGLDDEFKDMDLFGDRGFDEEDDDF